MNKSSSKKNVSSTKRSTALLPNNGAMGAEDPKRTQGRCSKGTSLSLHEIWNKIKKQISHLVARYPLITLLISLVDAFVAAPVSVVRNSQAHNV